MSVRIINLQVIVDDSEPYQVRSVVVQEQPEGSWETLESEGTAIGDVYTVATNPIFELALVYAKRAPDVCDTCGGALVEVGPHQILACSNCGKEVGQLS